MIRISVMSSIGWGPVPAAAAIACWAAQSVAPHLGQ
jgi:hypothetical protein